MTEIMRKVLRVDGTVEELDGPRTIAQIHDIVGADTLDNFVLADGVHVCLLDDSGLGRLPMNVLASALYHQRTGGVGHICGDVVVVPDSDFARSVR